MATVATTGPEGRRKIGPGDHGRPMTWDEYQHGDYEEGFHYELIDGRLYVSPQPNLPEGFIELWILRKLDRYSDAHPEVINFVHPKARVFVPGHAEVTTPEPDLDAYHDFPLETPIADLAWEDVSPVLVVEVLTESDPAKDLVRNVHLYRQVPSIREYWVLDPRADADQPTLRVYRRRGRGWRVLDFPFGATYTTRLLPGFSLTVDPRA